MKNFFSENRRISAKDLPKEIHMGLFDERCDECGSLLGMKLNPKSRCSGVFSQYCIGCKKEFKRIEADGELFRAFLILHGLKLKSLAEGAA